MTQPPRWRRYARLLGPDPVADVRDELRFHLEAKIDDLVKQGWHPAAARQEAERQFGDLRALQQIGLRMGEQMERRKRLKDYWSDSLQDLRYTFRALRRDLGFAVVSILIPGLAIGANVAVFSVVNGLLLWPLPFPESQELVWIAPPPSSCGLSCATYSADAFEEFRAQSRACQDGNLVTQTIARAGLSHNYRVELLYQCRTRRARSVFQRLALPTSVSISNGIRSA